MRWGAQSFRLPPSFITALGVSVIIRVMGVVGNKFCLFGLWVKVLRGDGGFVRCMSEMVEGIRGEVHGKMFSSE